jgi:Tfp pilus assembly protein PilW
MKTRNMNMAARKKQKGFGALEVMIALLIGVIVVVGAIVWYSKLRGAADKSTELENFSSLVSNVRLLRANSGYGASGADLVPVLINSDGVPGNMAISGTTISNSYGGVTIVSTGLGFTITFAGMPSADCIFLATKAAGSSSISTKMNSGTAITGEVSSSQANTGCSGSTNSIAWTTR